MKIVIFFLLLISSVKAQDSIPLKDGKLHFEEVVEVLNNSKENLYSKGKIWFVDNFKSADDVLQMDDKEAGILIGKGYRDIYVDTKIMGSIQKYKTRAFYTIKIQIKEGKYKLDIYDIYYYSYPTNGYRSGTTYIAGQPAVKSYPETWFLNSETYSNQKAIIAVNSYKKETLDLIKSLSTSVKDAMTKNIELDDF
jgi:hypothetical protein